MKGIVVVLMGMFLLAADKVEVVNLQQLRTVAEEKKDDTLYVVNFWATWCKPCVAEMPYFIEADDKYGPQKVKVVFVSLNYARELSKVNKFVADNKIKQQVL